MRRFTLQKQRCAHFFNAGSITIFYLHLNVSLHIFYALQRKVPPQAGLFFGGEKSAKMTLIENISEIALSKLQPIDGYVVEVNMRGERGSSIVEVYVDTDNGITADQCAQVNRHLATELDRLNLISGRYRLEVSSPGLDRPLKLGRQFIKNIGRQLKIISSDDSGKNATEGILQNANESTLTLVTRDKGERIFALNDIQEAYVLPKFK